MILEPILNCTTSAACKHTQWVYFLIYIIEKENSLRLPCSLKFVVAVLFLRCTWSGLVSATIYTPVLFHLLLTSDFIRSEVCQTAFFTLKGMWFIAVLSTFGLPIKHWCRAAWERLFYTHWLINVRDGSGSRWFYSTISFYLKKGFGIFSHNEDWQASFRF